jgi:sugar O-acyltransferase (sialic acid O-acetyltransferase NeuD family)
MNNAALVIYGCGGHGRSVADCAMRMGWREILFVDPQARPNERILDCPVYVEPPVSVKLPLAWFVAVGNNVRRVELLRHFQEQDKCITSLISPLAYVSAFAKIGYGVFVGAYSYLGPNANIGDGAIVNTAAVVEHDCIIESGAHISVNSTLAGGVRIGKRVHIGAGATVIDGISICEDVLVGAGAVVTSDILRPGTYVGVPARRVK